MDLRRRELGSLPGRQISALIASLLMGAVLLLGLMLTVPVGAREPGWGRQRPQDRTPSRPLYSLEPLIWSLDLGDWYEKNTSYVPDARYFGAYVIQPVTKTLYIGFGTGLPADLDGALLARYDGRVLEAAYQPGEQGIMDMTVSGSILYAAGVDPCCPDNWAWGNTYVLDPPDSVTKHRNLPRVIHSWGLWFDEDNAVLLAAVSSQERNPRRWTGEVYVSTDGAQSWTRLAGREVGVGDYRTYDVIGLGDQLFAVWNDLLHGPCGLADSSDGGATWTRLPVQPTDCGARLVVLGDTLLALTSDRSGLLAVLPSGELTTYPFPGFSVPASAYNYLAADRRGYLYTITDDGQVVRSANLTTWDTVVSTDLEFITISFWPERNWIVVADRGAGARLWRIDLSGKRFHHVAQAAEGPFSPAIITAIAARWLNRPG